MNIPSNYLVIFSSIISIGILRIRVLGSSGDSSACAVEADHLHNIPDILLDFDLDKVRYYLEIEVPAYINQDSKEGIHFQDQWNQLKDEFLSGS